MAFQAVQAHWERLEKEKNVQIFIYWESEPDVYKPGQLFGIKLEWSSLTMKGKLGIFVQIIQADGLIQLRLGGNGAGVTWKWIQNVLLYFDQSIISYS